VAFVSRMIRNPGSQEKTRKKCLLYDLRPFPGFLGSLFKPLTDAPLERSPRIMQAPQLRAEPLAERPTPGGRHIALFVGARHAAPAEETREAGQITVPAPFAEDSSSRLRHRGRAMARPYGIPPSDAQPAAGFLQEPQLTAESSSPPHPAPQARHLRHQLLGGEVDLVGGGEAPDADAERGGREEARHPHGLEHR
jgi:hypothetical protein